MRVGDEDERGSEVELCLGACHGLIDSPDHSSGQKGGGGGGEGAPLSLPSSSGTTPAAARALDRAATFAASSWSGRGALERKGDGAAALGRGTRTAAARRPTKRVILGGGGVEAELRKFESGPRSV